MRRFPKRLHRLELLPLNSSIFAFFTTVIKNDVLLASLFSPWLRAFRSRPFAPATYECLLLRTFIDNTGSNYDDFHIWRIVVVLKRTRYFPWDDDRSCGKLFSRFFTTFTLHVAVSRGKIGNSFFSSFFLSFFVSGPASDYVRERILLWRESPSGGGGVAAAVPLNVVPGVVTRVCVHSSVIIREITCCTRSLHTRWTLWAK